jgi:hypothetical protein
MGLGELLRWVERRRECKKEMGFFSFMNYGSRNLREIQKGILG